MRTKIAPPPGWNQTTGPRSNRIPPQGIRSRQILRYGRDIRGIVQVLSALIPALFALAAMILAIGLAWAGVL